MDNVRRVALRRILMFTVLVAVTACTDRLLSPDGRTVAGARATNDESCDDFSGGDGCEIEWDDTLACVGGWLIVNQRVVCDPQ